MTFIILSYTSSLPSLLSFFFLSLMDAECCQILLKICWWSCDFLSFIFVHVLYNTYWFVEVEPSLHPWNKPHFMVYDIFKYFRVATNCSTGHRCDSDLVLLWHRPAAAVLIWPLAWELPYTTGVAIKKKKKMNFFLLKFFRRVWEDRY